MHTKQVAPKILQELHATFFVLEVAKLTVRFQAGQGKGIEKLLDQSSLLDEDVDALIIIHSLTSLTTCFAPKLHPSSQAILQPA